MNVNILRNVLLGFFTTCLSLSAVQAAEFTGMAPEIWTGIEDEYGVFSFKGVPFAAPPTGDNRWRPPQPYQAQARSNMADKFAPACMQRPSIEGWYRNLAEKLGEDPDVVQAPEGGYSEDCLYLNIWTENLDPEAKMPVMVWMHGGGNSAGWSYEPNYRGHVLATEEVVVVSVPYRLGIFGYFSHPDLIAEQNGLAANYGLLDLIAALQWVQQHIGVFGGDAGNVTIFGESAGAANIGYLMASDQARGLFHRAIHQSAGYQQHSERSLDDLTVEGVTLSSGTGIATIEGLRALDSEALLQAIEQHLPGFSSASVVGGHALAQRPFDVFASGKQARIPLLIGSNQHEWLMYQSEDSSLAEMASQFGVADKLEEIEFALAGLPDIGQRDRLFTAQRMLCPSLEMAEQVSFSNQGAYVYHFTRVRSGSQWDMVGAYHGAEIPYIFNTHDEWLRNDPIDYAITAMVQDYWVNFARNGDPNSEGLPSWNSFNPDNPGVLNIGNGVGMKAAPDTVLCDLLGSL